ncbi:DDE superfamily endonuclease, partial [Phytophthora infestans]
GVTAAEAAPVSVVAASLSVHRSTVYRWKKRAALLADKKIGGKLLSYVEEIRKNRKLCLTTKCLTLMIAKFDGDFAAARQYTALCSWTVRFLKRNRLVVRRITHKGTKIRNEINTKYAGVFNMDQTAVCMDNPGRLTMDYCGAKNVDVAQGTAVNGGRCSVFLCASATGEKIAPFVVFAGVPGGPVSQEVSDLTFGDSSVIWRPSISGCRMLLLDILKVHKMTSVREHLEDACVTQVQYIPAGITGLSQPMDVSVMRSFKAKIQDLYVKYYIEHPFPSTAGDRRAMLSHLVGKAWVSVKPETIVNGFRKTKLLPIGPRDALGAFRMYLRPLPECSVVDEVEPDSE